MDREHGDDEDDKDHYFFGSKSGDFDIVYDWPAENDDKAQEHGRVFWESQELMLQEILEKCNSKGRNLKEQMKINIEKAKDSNICNCEDKNIKSCIKCLRQTVVNQLCCKGFNATLCTSKWKETIKIPGGSHEYIEVIASTQGRRKQIPFVVELGFQDEFKMGKASNEYGKLVDQLPEIYIGKTEHLNAIIRVVCEAARKSAKDGNIHMGPWRKRGFMEMKWSVSNDTKIFSKLLDELQISSSRKGSSNAARANVN